MLINIKKTMTILSTLLLGIMCSFCSDTIDVYAGQYGEEDGTSEPETPDARDIKDDICLIIIFHYYDFYKK